MSRPRCGYNDDINHKKLWEVDVVYGGDLPSWLTWLGCFSGCIWMDLQHTHTTNSVFGRRDGLNVLYITRIFPDRHSRYDSVYKT